MDTSVTIYFCPSTGEFAVFDREPFDAGYADVAEMTDGGTIRQRGDYWFFEDSNVKVGRYFSRDGMVMVGELAPRRDATSVFRDKRSFDNACIQLCGYTVDGVTDPALEWEVA